MITFLKMMVCLYLEEMNTKSKILQLLKINVKLMETGVREVPLDTIQEIDLSSEIEE